MSNAPGRFHGDRPLTRKAVVLAAGLGVRLRPLTFSVPKPLMPLGGEPLIEVTLRRLESWGVTDIAVNLHWQAAPLRDYLGRRRGSCRVTFSYEPVLLGTGGCLRPLAGFIGHEPFWLVNADIVWRADPYRIERAFTAAPPPLAATLLCPDHGPRTVETDAGGRITTYRSRRRGSAGTATFCGVQLVSPAVLQYLPPAETCSIVEAYEAAAAAGETVAGVVDPDARWDDAGTPEAWLRLRRLGGRRRAMTVAPRYPFRAVGSRIRYEAAEWPDPSLAPTLAKLGWPLRNVEVEPFDGRGSDRCFVRLHNGRRTAIHCRHGGSRPENARYAGHCRLLAEAGVPVPAVRAELPEARSLVLSDAGDCCLRDAIRQQPGQRELLYQLAVEVAHRLHAEGTHLVRSRQAELEPAFGPDVYRWERELFETHVLRNRYGMDGLPAPVQDEYGRVAARLTAGAAVLVHRDFQSTNLMVRRGRLVLIDFQGMRYGAAAYDLASLLCDPYVSLDEGLRRRLLGSYGSRGPEEAAAAADFAWGAVQRLTQALGAFGRLSSLGLPAWEAHIVPAARTLADMAAVCDLPAIAGLAENVIIRERARG